MLGISFRASVCFWCCSAFSTRKRMRRLGVVSSAVRRSRPPAALGRSLASADWRAARIAHESWSVEHSRAERALAHYGVRDGEFSGASAVRGSRPPEHTLSACVQAASICEFSVISGCAGLEIAF